MKIWAAKAQAIQTEAKTRNLVGLDEPEIPSTQIVPERLFISCKPYIQRIVREINGTYEKAFFSASAVMIRRLLETCMIEAFESKGLASQIKNANRDYKTGDEIKNTLLQDPFGNLSRNARRALGNRGLFELGHKSAHDRFFTAQKHDIDGIKDDFWSLAEYLVHQIA